MSKKAVWALMIAILIPLVSYFILKTAGDSAVIMPRKYFVETTIASEKTAEQVLIRSGIRQPILHWLIN